MPVNGKSALHFYHLRGDLSSPLGSCWSGPHRSREGEWNFLPVIQGSPIISFYFFSSAIFTDIVSPETLEAIRKINVWPETVLLSGENLESEGRSWDTAKYVQAVLNNAVTLTSSHALVKQHSYLHKQMWGALLLGSAQSCILIPNRCPICHNSSLVYGL